jgi:hypothetical protein
MEAGIGVGLPARHLKPEALASGNAVIQLFDDLLDVVAFL